MKEATPSIFFRILISTTLSILLSLLITSAILYVNFEKIALAQVYANDMDTLNQTAKGVNSLTNMAITLSNQIYNDPNVARLMYYANPDTEDLRTADDQLTNYRLSIPFIESVYVYNGMSGTFYVNSIINRNEVRETIQKRGEFDDVPIRELISSFRRHRPYQPIPRTYITNEQDQAVKNYYTFLVYDAFVRDELTQAVIINFSEEWITSYIIDNSPVKNSKTFILDDAGVVVSNSGLYPMMSDISEVPYIRKVLGSDESGSFMAMIDGTDYLVSFTKPDPTEWRYVKLTPKTFVLSGINRMKRVTIFIGLTLIIIGLVVSWFLSRRLYVPIDTLMATLRKLSLAEKKNVALLRNVFFRDILLGRGIYDGQTVELKLEELGTAFNAAGYYCIVLLKIDRHLSFSQDFTAVDQGLIKGSLTEECAAIVPGNAKRVILDMGNDGIAIILNSLEAKASLAPDVLEERLVGLRKTIAETHGLSVSFTVSNVEAGIQNLRDLYDETREASLYRMYRGHGCIIYAHEIQDIADNVYEYPSDAEKAMVSALRAGKVAEAKEQYDGIISGTANRPINAFNLMLSRLAFAVDETVKTIGKYGIDVLDSGKAMSIAGLNSAETLAEINARFYALFEEIGTVILDRKNNRTEQTVAKIDRHIESGYMRQDLCIDSIARYLDKSPTYISHIYKQHTGTTILDKIIDVRMSHAKDLLLSTELSVAEVSERTGFSSGSYFFKVFRKVNGVTPNEFRGREESSQ